MGLWQPETTTQFEALVLSAGDTPTWSYTMDRREKTIIPDGSPATVVFKNPFDQVIKTWSGEVVNGVAVFEDAAEANIPRGSTYTFTMEDVDGRPRQFRWGTVVRNEARYPAHPDYSDAFEGAQYEYSFGTPGFITDPAWRILNGRPRVYDNSGISKPNAVAAGSLAGGDLTVFDDVAMQYFAPLKTDAVRMTYQVVKVNQGDAWIMICSNYSADNYLAIRHTEVSGSGDYVAICTGSGPVTLTNRAQVTHTTASLETFTAEFNPASHTCSVYLGESLSPLVSWTDETGIVDHGPGERYIGMGFKSGLLFPGIELCNWFIQDYV